MHQRLLNLSIPDSRPLVPIEAAMVLLDLHYESLIGAIESGDLAWAWDIKARDCARSEVRIWRGSVMDALAGIKSAPVEESTVLDGLFGHSRPEIKSTELQRLFSCSHNHVYQLIGEGSLTCTSPATRGVNGFARLSRDGIKQYLRTRRII